MSNIISTFNFKSNPIRVELINNEPHFCLTDVCSALSINNANSSRFRFNEDGVHKMYSVDKLDRKNELTFINEPNLYRIIFRSNKAEAVDFQNWVFEEVLPQIRKTGKYEVQPKQLALPEPEKTYTLEFTEYELQQLVWLWCGFKKMNKLLGDLIEPLDNIGSRFSGQVYSHHHEYKRNHFDTAPTIKRMIEPFKQSTRLNWTRAINIITQ